MSHSSDQTPCFSALFLSRYTRWLMLWLVMLLAFSLSHYALADDQRLLNRALDGKTFQNRLGLKGQPFDVDDVLVFEDGQFVSQECERRCGYAKVEYWVRAQDDGIQMRAEAPCTDSGAVMYWTFEKEFRFKGRLVEADKP